MQTQRGGKSWCRPPYHLTWISSHCLFLSPPIAFSPPSMSGKQQYWEWRILGVWDNLSLVKISGDRRHLTGRGTESVNHGCWSLHCSALHTQRSIAEICSTGFTGPNLGNINSRETMVQHFFSITRKKKRVVSGRTDGPFSIAKTGFFWAMRLDWTSRRVPSAQLSGSVAHELHQLESTSFCHLQRKQRRDWLHHRNTASEMGPTSISDDVITPRQKAPFRSSFWARWNRVKWLREIVIFSIHFPMILIWKSPSWDLEQVN